MTYREHMHGLSSALAELVRDSAAVGAHDLDLALSSHANVLSLLKVVHAKVTGLAKPVHGTELTAVSKHPVAVLGLALKNYPVIAPLSLTDVLRMRPLDVTAARWRHAARHAALAFHEWTTADPALLPRSSDEAWAEVADLAALSEGLNAATRDLASSAHAAGRGDIAGRLWRAADAGLGVAAQSTAQLAALGPLDLGADLRPLPERRVLVVRQVEHVGRGLDRLELLMKTSTEVSPQQIQLVARMLASASDLAATSLSVYPDHDELTAALTKQADALDGAASAPRRLASIEGDPAVVEQANQVHRVLSETRRAGGVLPEHVALELARETGASTRMMNLTATRMVESKRWYSPSETLKDGEIVWEPALKAADEPALVRLSRAAGLRGRLTMAILPRDPLRTPWPPPREVLAMALARRSGQTRPERPSMPRRGVAVPSR